MKDLIRKILKEEEEENSRKTKLKNMVINLGWSAASRVVNTPEKLAKLAFNDDPMNFLNMFNDLDIVQSEEKEYWTLFRYERENNIMVYDKKHNTVYISYRNIWTFLEKGFGLKGYEIQELTQEWFSDIYNLRGVKTIMACIGRCGRTI
jgi:hypothetical protein